MLFNPQWDPEVSFRGFTAWVEAQNPRRRYVYRRKDTCAVGCWLKAINQHRLLGENWVYPGLLGRLDLQAVLPPHTYGALAKRLRALSKRPFGWPEFDDIIFTY